MTEQFELFDSYNTDRKIITIALSVILVAAISAIIFMPFYLHQTKNNELGTLSHLGYYVQVTSGVPNGQTQRFHPNAKSCDEFLSFLSYAEMNKTVQMYYVPEKINIIPLYQSSAIYFMYKGIIFLYQ